MSDEAEQKIDLQAIFKQMAQYEAETAEREQKAKEEHRRKRITDLAARLGFTEAQAEYFIGLEDWISHKAEPVWVAGH